MATPNLRIGRALATPATTGSSFREEQREQLWRRTRLLFLTGLTISLVSALVSAAVPSADPGLVGGPLRMGPLLASLTHAASFLIALGLLYAGRSSCPHLQTVAFATIGFNILLAVYNQVVFAPAVDPYFEIALLLFLSAAFIPWSTPYQGALALTAAIWYPALELLLYALFPEAGAYWAARGGAAAFRNHTIWGAAGTAVLGGASVMVTQTLYNLRKAAHHARQLGNYIIHKEIGLGGMGQVFVARHQLLCRPTAVKVMKAEDGQNREALARFEREVRLSATLTHPNTITIYDVGRTQDGSLYYAMEYLEGLDLQQLVERFGPTPAARAVHILRQVAGSLAEAHARNIVHRDIKPANIFLTRRGGVYDFVKVLDFGLAKQIKTDGDAASITRSGSLFGTPRYLAPETVYGNDEVDGRADLYNLGAVAYWMLTGRPPFTSDSSVALVVDHVKTIPQRPSEVAEVSIPDALDAIVMKLLEKRPADRFQSAEALERALEMVSLPERWSRQAAREWWNLHGIVGDDALDCECFFPDELPAEEEPALIAVEQPA